MGTQILLQNAELVGNIMQYGVRNGDISDFAIVLVCGYVVNYALTALFAMTLALSFDTYHIVSYISTFVSEAVFQTYLITGYKVTKIWS